MRNRKTILVVGLVMFVTLVGAVIKEPAVRAGTPDHFEIFFVNTDNNVRMGRFSFDEPLWQFGDRPGYRCAWAFLMADGAPVARVQFDRGQTYTSINDKYGDEKENDGSQCLSSGEELEVKPKPAGLADTIVNFVYGGSTIASLNFPATSPEDPDSWWELEEADPDHVEIELYWQKDVAVIATVTSLSPGMSLSTRSSEPPRINSFSPVSGRPGTAVTILGANFVAVTSVTFDRLPAEFQLKSAGEIVATVPEGATGSGPIAVTTATGTGTSRTEFSVADHVSHVSRVSLKLSGRLVASGSVTSIDGDAACARRRTVVIERRTAGKWKDVGKDKTSNAGSYREKLRNRGGKYRARVKKSTLANGDVCLRDVSAKRVH